MSMFRSVIDREIGRDRQFHYDSVLSRLAVEYSDPESSKECFGPPIYACEFSESQQYKHYLATADGSGKIKIYDTTKGRKTCALTKYQCLDISIFDIAWMPNQTLFATASDDYTVRLWDIGTGNVFRVQDFQSYTKTVRVVVFRPEDCSVFATGGCDSCILIWDTRCNSNVLAVAKPENIINVNNRHSIALRTRSSYYKYKKIIDHRLNSITGLAFQDDNTLISCGFRDGNIRVWDLRKNYSLSERDPVPKYSFGHCRKTKYGYSNIVLDKSKLKLYANCLNDEIYCYNVGTYNDKPDQTYTGSTTSDYTKASLSPDGKYLVSSSIGENAYIWNVKRSTPIIGLGGHDDEVTCARWSQLDNILIATCGDNMQLNLWTIPKFQSCGVVQKKSFSKKSISNATPTPTPQS